MSVYCCCESFVSRGDERYVGQGPWQNTLVLSKVPLSASWPRPSTLSSQHSHLCYQQQQAPSYSSLHLTPSHTHTHTHAHTHTPQPLSSSPSFIYAFTHSVVHSRICACPNYSSLTRPYPSTQHTPSHFPFVQTHFLAHPYSTALHFNVLFLSLLFDIYLFRTVTVSARRRHFCRFPLFLTPIFVSRFSPTFQPNALLTSV